MARMSGADALVAQLMANGIDTIFGLPGGQLDHLLDAIYRTDGGIRFISSRHEQGAAYMALGFARSTGRPAVYAVVPGPGVLNTTAALCTAYATNAPVLCLTGQIPSEGIGSGIGYLHELPDQLGVLQRLTRFSHRAMTPQEAPAAVNQAFKKMLRGRPGPVSLEMPPDVMEARAEVRLLRPVSISHDQRPDSQSVEAAVRLMRNAQRPVILIGGGAIGARERVIELAGRLQAPVVSFRMGRGIVSDHSHLSQCLPAGYELWKDADLAIGIGSRMEQPYLHWGVADHMRIIRIDIDGEEIGRHGPPTVALNCDAGVGLRSILAQLDKTGVTRPSRAEELMRLKRQVRSRIESIQPQVGFLDAIREALPEDGFLVDEVTQVGYTSWYAFPVYEPRRLVTAGYQGTLGYGFATALGVKQANPDSPVVSISGDGGFLYTCNELATAVKYGIGLVAVVFNNNKFENVQRQQKEWFEGRIIESDLKNPDFVRFAQSFGIYARRVQGAASLKRELIRCLERNRPALIEVRVGDSVSPWPLILRERLFPKA